MRAIALRHLVNDWINSSPASGSPNNSSAQATVPLQASVVGPAAFGMIAAAPAKSGKSLNWKSTGPFLVTILGNVAVMFATAQKADDSPQDRLSKEVYHRELQRNTVFGLVGTGALSYLVEGNFAHVANGLIVGAELLSTNVAKGRNHEREKVREELVNGSHRFGSKMRTVIAHLIVDSVNQPGSVETVDWPRFAKNLRQLYPLIADVIEPEYRNLEYTGFLCPEAQEIKDLISVEGETSPGAYKSLLRIGSENCHLVLADVIGKAQEIFGPDFEVEYLIPALHPDLDPSFPISLSEEEREQLEMLQIEATKTAVVCKMLEAENSKGL